MFSIRSTAFAVLALSLSLGMPFSANAADVPPVSGTCGTAAAPLTGLKFYTATTAVSTTSFNTFMDVNSTTIGFKQTRAGCVIISFSGEVTNDTANSGVQVRAILNGGAIVCEPPVVTMGIYNDTGLQETRAMNFICPNVPAGNHIAKIQYRSTGTMGSTSTIGARSTIVRFMQ